MKAEVKEKWVAALRSGEYQQAHGMLRNVDENSFCCLGVLCDLAIKDGLKLRVEDLTYEGDPDAIITYYDGISDILPDKVAKWANLSDSPEVRVSDETDAELGTYNACLAELNDNGWTFAQLAGLIEESL